MCVKCEKCKGDNVEVLNEEINDWNGEMVCDCYCYDCECSFVVFISGDSILF